MSTTRYVDIERSLQNLENELHPENVQAVQEFINQCAAEGLSDVRQRRHIQSWKTLLKKFAPDDFTMYDASEQEIKDLVAKLNRSDYAEATKRTMKGAIKKFYKFENGGHDHPEKVDSFTIYLKKKEEALGMGIPLSKDEFVRRAKGYWGILTGLLIYAFIWIYSIGPWISSITGWKTIPQGHSDWTTGIIELLKDPMMLVFGTSAFILLYLYIYIMARRAGKSMKEWQQDKVQEVEGED